MCIFLNQTRAVYYGANYPLLDVNNMGAGGGRDRRKNNEILINNATPPQKKKKKKSFIKNKRARTLPPPPPLLKGLKHVCHFQTAGGWGGGWRGDWGGGGGVLSESISGSRDRLRFWSGADR